MRILLFLYYFNGIIDKCPPLKEVLAKKETKRQKIQTNKFNFILVKHTKISGTLSIKYSISLLKKNNLTI